MIGENYQLDDIVASVDVQTFKRLLTESEYSKEESDFLLTGFTKGFSLGYQGPRNRQTLAKNLRLRVGSKLDLWNKLIKEVQLGRVSGPWRDIPYDQYIQSPIGLVPKHEPGQTRLIFHLSYPEGESVNDYIPDSYSKVQYQDLDKAVQMCLEKEGELWVAKADLKNAFRELPIRRQDRRWLVMKAQHPTTGEVFYFVEKNLCFGSSCSCFLFQKFSDALAHVYRFRSQNDICNYLDDFFFAAIRRELGNQLLRVFLEICQEINFPVAMDKTVWAIQLLVFLGILLDAINRTLSIPEDKRQKALGMLDRVVESKKVTVMQLQQLTGLLNFICRAVVPGRAFTRRLYAAFSGKKLKQHHHVRVNQEMRLDCKVWLDFLKLDLAVCRPFMDLAHKVYADELDWYTDAAKSPLLGCAGVFGRKFFVAQWPPGFLARYDPSI